MADQVNRVYSNFRGVDFRGEEINLVRSPDALNVWKDYKETESIRTRPEMELKEAFDDTIYGIFFYKGMMLVHCGDVLYKVANGVKSVLKTGLNKMPSDAFVFGESAETTTDTIWYFKDGKGYYQYDGVTFGEVVGYVPTTSIGRKPLDGGTKSQDINLLTGRRKNTFLSDGESQTYYLDAYNIDEVTPIVKMVNESGKWEEVTFPFTVNFEEGSITFTDEVPAKPFTDGQDNVEVEFSKTLPNYREAILNTTMLTVFDNRVFFAGDPNMPNVVWHCSLNDPTYCSDTDYYNEGTDPAEVRGMVAGNNALWVFREPSDANTTVFYHTPTIDDTYGKIYPNTHSSITTGCIGKAINFNDDIVFFSERGMEGISGDVTTEQVLGHRSTLVDRKLIAEGKYGDMCLAEWEGYLLVFIGHKAYLADSRAVFTNEDHIEYDWFYWEMPHEITCAKVHNGVLYLGADGGVYTLTDNESPVVSYWTTPKDKFKYPQKLKTTNKRGCVVEATGDISVYAKTEKTDFELIDNYESVTDYFVSRIKKKKFKDLQLKFYSEKRFSLETATMEAFIGGYIKR